MKRVEQFESLLRKMDVVVTCLAGLTVAFGIFPLFPMEFK